MRRTTRLATILVLAVGLCLTTVATAAAAGEPRTPQERLEAIVPLVEAAAMGADGFDKKLANRAAQTQIPEQRLELWTMLFLSHGKRGLHVTDRASSIELARAVEGTWEMSSRVVDGEVEETEMWQWNRILELRDGYARVESMTLEHGYLAPTLCDGNQDCLFSLGSYGVVIYEDVTGLEYGLAEGEVAVKMDFEGHISGEGYPGFENDVRGIVTGLWVKHGDVYRTANFKHRFEGLTRELRALPEFKHEEQQQTTIDHALLPQNDAILELVGSTQSLEYEQMQAVETQNLVSPTVAIWDLSEYWNMAKNDIRYIKPEVGRRAVTPNAARHAMQRAERLK